MSDSLTRGRPVGGARHSRARRVRTTVFAMLVLLVAVGSSGCGRESRVIVFDGPMTTSTRPPDVVDTTLVPAAVEKYGPWTDATANLAGMASDCGNMGYVGGWPGTNQFLAGVATQGLFVNDQANGEWRRIGVGSPVQITNRVGSVVFDPSTPSRFWMSGSYGEPGVARTSDDGRTFEKLGSMGHLDGLGVDLDDPARRTMLVGGHERNELFRSTDGGASWTTLTIPLPDGSFPSWPLVRDAQTYLVGTTKLTTASTSIMRTTDGGATWSEVYQTGVAGPPLRARDRAIYWVLQDGGGVVRSTDGGATFTRVTRDGALGAYNVVELPDGRLLSASASYAVVSADQGRTWRALGPRVPMTDPFGVAFSESQNAVMVWKWDCGKVVQPGSVQRLSLVPTG